MSTGIAALLAMGSNEDTNPGLLLATVTSTAPTVLVQIDGATTTTTATKTVPVFTGDRVIVEFIGKSAYITHNVNYDTGWVVPTLGSGWVAAGGWAQTAYRRRFGIVYLKGTMINGTLGQAPFFLPSLFRPAENRMFPDISTSTYGRTQVRTDGAVFIDSGGSTAGWSIDGIVFPAEA